MDDLGVPLVLETPACFFFHLFDVWIWIDGRTVGQLRVEMAMRAKAEEVMRLKQAGRSTTWDVNVY